MRHARDYQRGCGLPDVDLGVPPGIVPRRGKSGHDQTGAGSFVTSHIPPLRRTGLRAITAAGDGAEPLATRGAGTFGFLRKPLAISSAAEVTITPMPIIGLCATVAAVVPPPNAYKRTK
jgi:hypothetical protein